jgi:hypothetical protein
MFRRVATYGGESPNVTGSAKVTAVGHKGGKVAAPAPKNPATLEWAIVSCVPVGKDELRSEYRGGTFDPPEEGDPTLIPGDTFEPDPENPELRLGGVVYSQHGQRSYTFEVRIESPNAESKPANLFAQAMVDRMRLPSVADELEALGLAFVGWDEITDDLYDGEDGRAVSVYIAHMFMNGASYSEDLPVTTIESAQVATDVSS